MKRQVFVLCVVIFSLLMFSASVYAIDVDECPLSYGEKTGAGYDQMLEFAKEIMTSLISNNAAEFSSQNPFEYAREIDVFSEVHIALTFVFEDGATRGYEFYFEHTSLDLEQYTYDVLPAMSEVLWVDRSMYWHNGRPLPTGLEVRVNTTGPNMVFSGVIPRRNYFWITGAVYRVTFAGNIPRIS